MTLNSLRTVLSQTESGRILHALCGVLEQWSEGIRTYFCSWDQCPFPRMEEARFIKHIYPLFFYVVQNWLGCEEEEDKQAVLKALAAMSVILLHEKQHTERVWEQLLWLLHQHRDNQGNFQVTKMLHYFLESLEGVRDLIPVGKFTAISAAVHAQLSDAENEPSPAHKEELSRCIVLLGEERRRGRAPPCPGSSLPEPGSGRWLPANTEHHFLPASQSRPEEMIAFLRSQLHGGKEAGRVAALRLLGALASQQDVPAIREKLPLVVEAAQSACSDPSAQLLWPRLLQYVVPAQYRGMLIPLSRCLQSLAERRERAGQHEEEDSDVTSSEEEAQLPAPQALLARLLVESAAPRAGAEHTVAALKLLQALRSTIHGALGAAWTTEIAFLLQYLEGKDASSVDSAEWECHLLKFLKVSLESMEDQAWSVALSQQLSEQLGTCPHGSWEKLFLYKALGSVLAACQDLSHVQEQLCRYLQGTNHVELSEAQGMIAVVSFAAERHFHLALDTVTTVAATLTRGRFPEPSGDWKNSDRLCRSSPAPKVGGKSARGERDRGCAPSAFLMGEPVMQGRNRSQAQSSQLQEKLGELLVQGQKNKEEAQAAHIAVMLTYSGMALHAPREHLLARVDADILGKILLLARAGHQDSQLKLALVQSITEVSCAIQAVGDCPGFGLLLKQEALGTLLDWIKEEPQDMAVYPMLLTLEQLSKVKPSLSREENRCLLSECCQSVFSHPSMEEIKARRRPLRAALNIKVLHDWLTSFNALEQERVLRVCAQVLGACEGRFELMKGCTCKQFGTLVGLLGPLTCDFLATCRKWAGVCLDYLLQMHAKTTNVKSQTWDTEHLCEEQESPDETALLETSNKTAQTVCRCFPSAQATDFMSMLAESLLHHTDRRAWAAGMWMTTFLEHCGKQLTS
ncbi:maestro heat-like repeat-containing protein family member 2B isoform X2 [Numida meleagris]|uniref:maestro heat-like repeat-containing protein family member 2B isoform X2 n=1 Tax=Numida meleagris TaxID=8996 RepID=UPI000B3D85E8|nr:maestro heat-like repeat-containing protein family member 2B isoform X2 [Numida meleagris]